MYGLDMLTYEVALTLNLKSENHVTKSFLERREGTKKEQHSDRCYMASEGLDTSAS